MAKRIDWWRVITDLIQRDWTLVAISAETLIPKSTLRGYRNLDVEPKHADGEALLDLWKRVMLPVPPTKPGRLRQREL